MEKMCSYSECGRPASFELRGEGGEHLADSCKGRGHMVGLTMRKLVKSSLASVKDLDTNYVTSDNRIDDLIRLEERLLFQMPETLPKLGGIRLYVHKVPDTSSI